MLSRRSLISQSLRYSLKMMAVTGTLIPILSKEAIGELFGSIPEDMPAGRSIYRLKGLVLVNGQPADLNTLIPADATIRTGDGAEVIFVVGDDAYILRQNSELELSADSALKTGLKLLTGGLLSVFGRRENGSSIELESSTSTIGIRGTGVYMESYPDYSYVCTCYGISEISAMYSAERLRVEAEHHDDPKFIYRNADSNLIQPAPLINHTDAELALIEALVGRVPPFPNFLESYGGAQRRY